ncbi:hypothetical protein J1N10_13940 [Carboxylicivirga sp. A043]|uniref:hypothetical protein n=1 Tax=Carboxylicivirga litoralis TaxID=2816963 RepID=UPI0021CB69B3|nr:hypothetical protein [Carboxylicivirga sp. A043]MCU4157085.1 hypothetical protein [Carboxylicivirga sp. A043]
MKNLFCLLILAALSVNSFAQLSDDNRALYQSKVENYTKMKKTGTTLGIAGAGLTVIGIALVASADWETETDSYGNSQTTTNDGSGVLGVLSLCAGIPMAVTGIVLGSVGSKKAAEYSRKLENVNVGYFKKGQQKGITLAIKF